MAEAVALLEAAAAAIELRPTAFVESKILLLVGGRTKTRLVLVLQCVKLASALFYPVLPPRGPLGAPDYYPMCQKDLSSLEFLHKTLRKSSKSALKTKTML